MFLITQERDERGRSSDECGTLAMNSSWPPVPCAGGGGSSNLHDVYCCFVGLEAYDSSEKLGLNVN